MSTPTLPQGMPEQRQLSLLVPSRSVPASVLSPRWPEGSDSAAAVLAGDRHGGRPAGGLPRDAAIERLGDIGNGNGVQLRMGACFEGQLLVHHPAELFRVRFRQ